MNVLLAHTKQTYTTYASFYQRVQIKKVTFSYFLFFCYGDVFAYAISSSTQETLTLNMFACLLILFQRPAATRDINSVTIQPDRHGLHVLERDLNNRCN